MSDQNQSQQDNKMSNERPRIGINSVDGKAFVSGMVFALACRLSGSAFDWWRFSSLNDEVIFLAVPIMILVFLGIFWIAQRVLRAYFDFEGFEAIGKPKNRQASAFVAFILGYFCAGFIIETAISLVGQLI